MAKRRKSIKWTPAMEQQLIILRQAGVKPRDVARIMGISRIAVYNRSSVLGITKAAPATKTEFRESPKEQIEQPKQKPSWWSRLFGVSDMGEQ